MATVQQVVQAAAGRLGIPVPAAVVGAKNTATAQLLGLLTEVAEFLISEFDFTEVTKYTSFSATGAVDQGPLDQLAGGVVGEFNRVVPGSFRNDSLDLNINPIGAADYNRSAGGLPLASIAEFRVQGGHLLTYPALGANQRIGFSWISNAWLRATDGQAVIQPAADSDEVLFDQGLMVIGLRAYWRREKGLSYADLFNDFQARAEDRAAKTRLAPTLHLDGTPGLDPATWPGIVGG